MIAGSATKRLEASTSGNRISEAASALEHALKQQAELLSGVSDDQFIAAPSPGESCIGAQIRHCLDHVRALLDGSESSAIDYDNRQRGTSVETDRQAALTALSDLRTRLANWSQTAEDAPVSIRMIVCGDGAGCSADSTLARELLFVLSHTIHHNAMIAVAARAVGVTVPDGFGYAPSTLAHRNECAR